MSLNKSRFAGTVLAVACALALTMPVFAQIPDLPEVPPSVPVDVPFTPVVSVYEEDFELDDGGWTASEVPPPPARVEPVNPQWEWGAPTSGPGGAYNGTNVWGVNLDGPYSTPHCAGIMSPSIDLTSASTAALSFRHWLHMDTGSFIAFHGGLLFVTTDGGDTLTRVTPQGGYPSVGLGLQARGCLDDAPSGTTGYSGGPSASYSEAVVNLDSFVGQEIQFVIGFGTDARGDDFAGWYIDEFGVTIDGSTHVEPFEDSDGGFTVVGTQPPGDPPHGWSLDQPTAGPDHVGRTWATNPHGVHGHDECHWVESPPIQLGAVPAGAGDVLGQTPVQTASLTWLQHFRTSLTIGQGVVQVGTSDGEYHLVTPDGGYDRPVFGELAECLGDAVDVFAGLRNDLGGAMDLQSADLTPWLGEEITIRFLFATRDWGSTHTGWYVDDVKVELGFGASTQIPLPEVPEEPEVPFTPLLTVYAEDFEGTDGDWTQSGTGEWEWGSPSPPPLPPSGSFNMWGTQLSRAHSTNACSFITSPSISLPGVGAAAGATESARLSFELFVDTTNRHDGAILEVSKDGGANWQYVTPDQGYDDTLLSASGAPAMECLGVGPTQPVWTGPAANGDDWSTFDVDLSAYMGDELLLRFGFASNALDDERRGVYLDRLTLSLGAGATVGPPDDSQLGVVFPGWEVTGDSSSWLWGIPTTGPSSLRPAWATNLHGPYNPGECSAITSRSIDTGLIPGLGRLELTFQHFFNTPLTTHAGLIQVSRDDGANWDKVTPVGGYPNNLGVDARACLTPGETGTRGYAAGVTTSGYDSVTVPLRDYEDETIRIRFAFHSTSTTNLGAGWYLRDLGLTRGAGSIPLSDEGSAMHGAQETRLEDALRLVADDSVLRLIEEAEMGATGDAELILTGAAHDAQDVSFDSRSEWNEWFDKQAAAYFLEVEGAAEAFGVEVVTSWSSVPAVKVRAPIGTIALLAGATSAEHIVEDHEAQVHLIEPIESGEDDGFGVMNNEGRKQIQAEEVWDLGFKGEGIRIAVIDTGIDVRHEAFKKSDGSSRVVAFADCIGINGCDDTVPAYDDHGHGTHVAATAAGSDLYDDPDHGVFEEVGVAPRADILGVRFLNAGGSGSLQDALDALQWSFDNGADLTSNSWGSGCGGSTSVVQLVNQLTDAGMLSVSSAGNSGPSSGTVGSPACAYTALAVGAVNGNEQIASFSSRGPCTDPSMNEGQRVCPHLVAKGVAVRSAIPRDSASWADASGYRVWDGTSMSGPHVAGAVVLIEQMKREFTASGWDTPAQAEKQVLTMTAKPLGQQHPNNDYGWGMPQLLTVHQLLDSAQEANIAVTFEVGAQELWVGDSTLLRFGVQNLGGAVADGEFTAHLTDPEGEVTTLAQAILSLGLLDGKHLMEEFLVTNDVLPGEYTFEGSFQYTWTDPDGIVHEEIIERSANFTVFRVFMEFEMEGFAEQTSLFDVQDVRVAMTNTGNEPGRQVRMEVTVPDAYWFVPPSLPALLEPNGKYSDPAPDEVHEDSHFGRTTLIYFVDDLDVDATFEVELSLLPMETGTHWIRAVGKFEDGAGNPSLQSKTLAQQVDLI